MVGVCSKKMLVCESRIYQSFGEWYFLKIVRLFNPINYRKGIGKVILNSMVITNKLVTNKQLVSCEIDTLVIIKNDEINTIVDDKDNEVYNKNNFRKWKEIYELYR